MLRVTNYIEERVEQCPNSFELLIVDEDCCPIQLREPLPYRVCDESGSTVQEGVLESEARIRVVGDRSQRYCLYIDEEFVTFHDETTG